MKEKLIIEDFETIGGKHCQTTALQHILNHAKLPVSEEMLLGLGGGIGFIYWYMKLMPAPFTGTRNGKVDEFLLNACSRIGAEATLFQTASAKKAYQKVKDILRSGSPAYIFVDMAYLPYLALPEEAHFGGHCVAVFGIDETTDTAYIADNGKHPFSISLEALSQAMGSKHPPFAAKNKILEVKLPSQIPADTLKNGIRDSIKNCCENMMNPPITNLGLKGLIKWAKLLKKWPAQFQEMNLLACIFNVFIYIEIGGTGGSGFRPMYARFLKESAQILNNPALAEVADLFIESGKLWKDIAENALPDSWPTLKEIKDLTYEKGELFDEKDSSSFERMVQINKESSTLMHKAAKELEAARGPVLDTLMETLRQKILLCHDAEEIAIKKLSEVIRHQ
ncbi:MAG: BtrH N-terminal domain-containing protein [bacterium]|nr:BtrH N-terminal domain-containing protein [bacterium]